MEFWLQRILLIVTTLTSFIFGSSVHAQSDKLRLNNEYFEQTNSYLFN